jgi:hypothetical protein
MDDSNAVGNTDMGLGLMEMRSSEKRGEEEGKKEEKVAA